MACGNRGGNQVAREQGRVTKSIAAQSDPLEKSELKDKIIYEE